jgi:hypothetical protein
VISDVSFRALSSKVFHEKARFASSAKQASVAAQNIAAQGTPFSQDYSLRVDCFKNRPVRIFFIRFPEP